MAEVIADLCLVLLLDASGSVDAAEWELQAKATADALSSPAILEQIRSGRHGRIAISAMEWSSAAVEILPWRVIATEGDARSAGLAIATYMRRQSGSTALGDALISAGSMFNTAVVPDCERRVVDVSGDGTSNAGSSPKDAVAFLQAMDVQVNAIVIPDEIGVLEYYDKIVSGFVLEARWPAYGEAIRRKLALEIAGVHPVGTVRFAAIDTIALPGGGDLLIAQPWDLGWPAAPEGPLPFYPDLRVSESVPAPGGALLLGLALAGVIGWRGWR